MKKLLLIIVVSLFVIAANAQSPMFLKGDRHLKLSLGINPYSLGMISVDYGLVGEIGDLGTIGVGPFAHFGFNSKYNFYNLGVRGTFHYPVFEGFDTYAGIGMGLRMNRELIPGLWGWDLTPGFFLGANYPINDAVALFGEVGVGSSLVMVGLSIDF